MIAHRLARVSGGRIVPRSKSFETRGGLMPAYRFSWDAFDDRTVSSLATELGFAGSDGARAWLADRVKRPTPDFVGEVKDILVATWLPEYAGAGHIVDRLLDAGVGSMRNARSQNGYVKYIAECRNSKRLRQYISEAMLRFGDVDRVGDAEAVADFVPRFATLRVRDQPRDPRRPHAYQVLAWEKLSGHLAEARNTGVFQGLLVMPTGSGKTYTAVRWICENVLSQGMRVLWLAHRHELLTHAGAEFQRLAGLAAPLEKLRVRIVSGAHCTTTQIDPADHVVVAAVQSLARQPEIASDILSDKRLFIVIDEAHHAPAKSYRDIIKAVHEIKPWHVLGLTATPTRTIKDERPVLARLFGGNIIAQVELGRLVEQRILARPIPVIVQTEADIEEGVTPEDRAHYDRFNELSEDWLARIGQISGRNRLIVQHYLEKRGTYGPTLVFAVNVNHAALLAEMFRAAGVEADYVASYRPDGTPGDPIAVIERFRNGQLDVLVNVQIMTEGVDVPAIQTVFLTRPTLSEILMRQMIGRALRGPAAGGTEKAYLVSFEDHWNDFRDWDSPFSLVPDIDALAREVAPDDEGQEVAPPSVRIIDQLYDKLPWETIRAVAASIEHRAPQDMADAFEAVPDGWLVIERIDEDQEILEHIATYSHQRVCWDALVDSLRAKRPSREASIDMAEIWEEFFADCDVPAPSLHNVGQVVRHFQHGGEPPRFHDLVGRKDCDPYEVARQIRDRDLGRSATSELIRANYSTLAQAIYPALRDYQSAVEDALYELEHPEEATRMPRAVPVFHPRPDQQLPPGPTHDLDRLMAEVLVEGSKLLGIPLAYAGQLNWSKRILKSWQGMAYFREIPPRVVINRLLDSSAVSEATLRFLLWHEFLHVHLRQLHTPTFRELERKWVDWNKAERELDTLGEKFEVSYW